MKRKVLVIFLGLLCAAWLDPYQERVSSGNTHYHNKKYKKAIKKYKKAEKYAPGQIEKRKLAFNKGDAFFMTGDYDNAITGYQNAIQADRRDVQKKAFFNLGNTYLSQGKYKEAVRAYINALKIDPHYTRAKRNLEYILKNKKNKKKNKDKKDKKNKKGANKPKNGGKSRDKSKSGQKEKQPPSRVSREQIKNILKSMKNNPVRRRKGNANSNRSLEKYW